MLLVFVARLFPWFAKIKMQNVWNQREFGFLSFCECHVTISQRLSVVGSLQSSSFCSTYSTMFYVENLEFRVSQSRAYFIWMLMVEHVAEAHICGYAVAAKEPADCCAIFSFQPVLHFCLKASGSEAGNVLEPSESELCGSSPCCLAADGACATRADLVAGCRMMQHRCCK